MGWENGSGPHRPTALSAPTIIWKPWEPHWDSASWSTLLPWNQIPGRGHISASSRRRWKSPYGHDPRQKWEHLAWNNPPKGHQRSPHPAFLLPSRSLGGSEPAGLGGVLGRCEWPPASWWIGFKEEKLGNQAAGCLLLSPPGCLSPRPRPPALAQRNENPTVGQPGWNNTDKPAAKTSLPDPKHSWALPWLWGSCHSWLPEDKNHKFRPLLRCAQTCCYFCACLVPSHYTNTRKNKYKLASDFLAIRLFRVFKAYSFLEAKNS